MFGFWFPFILTLIKPPALSNQPWYLLFGPLTLLEWLQLGCVRKRSSSSLKLWARCLIPQRYIPRKSCMVPDSTFPRPCIFLTTMPRDPGVLEVGLFSNVTLMQGWDPSLNWASDNLFTHTLLRQVKGDTYNITLQKTEITYWFFLFRKFLSDAFHSVHLLAHPSRSPTVFFSFAAAPPSSCLH